MIPDQKTHIELTDTSQEEPSQKTEQAELPQKEKEDSVHYSEAEENTEKVSKVDDIIS